MDRSRVAEWALSLVLPAERAAAVTGDFLEEAGERGGFWFWSSVFRTAAAAVWSDIREAPGELIWLGVRASLANFVSMCGYIFCFSLLSWPVGLLIAWITHEQPPMAQWGWLVGFVVIWIAARQSGRSLGRQAPDRKLAACIIFFFVYQLLPLAIGLVIEQFWTSRSSQLLSFSWRDPFVQLVFWVALVYGALKSEGRKPLAQG